MAFLGENLKATAIKADGEEILSVEIDLTK
jgi:hypothetical protein